MTATTPSRPAVPGWFTQALETPCESRHVEVGGTPIHYLYWARDEALPGLVLVHGNGAHAHWWDFIAPFFLDHYRVAALDLSGMGDSGHRDAYSPELFAEEVVSVARDAGFGKDTIVIGHSFGGFVTIQAAIRFGDELAGVVLVDSPVRPPDYAWERDPKRSPIRPKRTYPTFDEALGRFRLMPPQDCHNDFILDHIGRTSLMQVDDGWTWKFDDQMFSKLTNFHNSGDDLKRLPCRVAVIYGDDSYLFDQEIADYMFKVLDESVPFMALPEAQHHVFLDQPLAFVAAIRMLLAEWRHSRPDRRPRGVGER
ncbi:MAG TPA: alpha/beta hydrolase [Pseudomonadales bacterium]|nr:alpha/beta hydrolase [Pseudomonadales bacterium]